MCIDTEGAEGRRHAEFLVVVGLPLPLPAHHRRIELVALNGIDRPCARSFRLRVADDRLALLTHYRPAVRPIDGLQMNHTTVCFLILEVQKPVLAVLRMHPTTLMRAVDISLALC